jgi:ferredoxin
MKVEILREKCVGSGNCVELVPKIFGQSEEDGKVVLTDGDETYDEAALQAALLCPVGRDFN